jgi:hypothetical protein
MQPQFRLNARERLFCALAVAIGILWAVGSYDFEHPDPVRFAVCAIGVALLPLIAIRDSIAPPVTLAFAAAVGLAARYGMHYVGGSDVLAVTSEAISVLASGNNPYAHTFQDSIPPGSRFAYFPGEILFYAIFSHVIGISSIESLAAVAILLEIAMFAVAVGYGSLYGRFPFRADFRSPWSTRTYLWHSTDLNWAYHSRSAVHC